VMRAVSALAELDVRTDTVGQAPSITGCLATQVAARSDTTGAIASAATTVSATPDPQAGALVAPLDPLAEEPPVPTERFEDRNKTTATATPATRTSATTAAITRRNRCGCGPAEVCV
jgi:hypothetical protein